MTAVRGENSAMHRPALVAALCAAACNAPMTYDPSELRPPVAKRVAHENHWHGQVYVDHYHWLRDKEHPDVRAYLEAENAWTKARTADLKALEDRLYEEMVARVQETDESVPVRMGGYHYYSRTVEGLQYAIRCRKASGADGRFDEAADEQVLLDQNEMAKGLDYLGIGDVQVSDGEGLLAFTTDVTGFRQYTLHVKRPFERATCSAGLAERVTSLEWAGDDRDVVLRHRGSSHQAQQQAVSPLARTASRSCCYEEDRRAVLASASSRTKDRRYLVLTAFSTDTYECRYLARRCDRPGSSRCCCRVEKGPPLHRRRTATALFYLRTDKDALNWRIVAASRSTIRRRRRRELARTSWRTVTTCSSRGSRCSRDFAVVQERVLGPQSLPRSSTSRTALVARDHLPGGPSTPRPQGGTPEFTSTTYRIDYRVDGDAAVRLRLRPAHARARAQEAA